MSFGIVSGYLSGCSPPPFKFTFNPNHHFRVVGGKRGGWRGEGQGVPGWGGMGGGAMGLGGGVGPPWQNLYLRLCAHTAGGQHPPYENTVFFISPPPEIYFSPPPSPRNIFYTGLKLQWETSLFSPHTKIYFSAPPYPRNIFQKRSNKFRRIFIEPK